MDEDFVLLCGFHKKVTWWCCWSRSK